MGNVIYFNELARLITKLRCANISDEEIRQMLGLDYRADLNKFIK